MSHPVPSLHISILGSGSSGNAAVVTSGETTVLIDAGLSARQLHQRLEAAGIPPETLTAILLTHEHGDHTQGLNIFCKKFPVPIYCNALTRESLHRNGSGSLSWRVIASGQPFEIGNILVDSFTVPHDAVEPLGYVLSHEGSRLGVLSDIGHITNIVRQRLKGVHTLFTESNYDEHLLDADTKRPWSTKQRISSRHGHLSNAQTAGLVREISHPELHRVILGHLSKDCNHPDLAAASIRDVFQEAGLTRAEVNCACPRTPSPLWPVAPPPRPVTTEIPSRISWMQAELF